MEMAGCGQAAADVGTDHAHVPIELVRRGSFSHVTAMDVRKGPLKGAAENVAAAGLSEAITLRLGDGLHPLEAGEADTILISGMGGPLMERILTEGMDKAKAAKKLVLSPQSELPHFRRFLLENGFAITDEALVEEEGKFYLILKAEPGGRTGLPAEALTEPKAEPAAAGSQEVKDVWTEAELTYGKYLIRENSPEIKAFIARDIRIFEEILTELDGMSGGKAAERRGAVERQLVLARTVQAVLKEGEKHEGR